MKIPARPRLGSSASAERSRTTAFRDGARDRAALRPVAMIPIPYALDALNFLAADVRNLFGPFVNVFLVTGQHWSQTDVGLVTTASGLLGIALPDPDRRRDRRDARQARRHRSDHGGDDRCRGHHLCRSNLLADGARLERAGGRGRRLCSRGLGADAWPRDERQARAAPRPQLRLRPRRQHRDRASGRRGRLCVLAARGLSHGSRVRRSDLRRPCSPSRRTRSIRIGRET